MNGKYSRNSISKLLGGWDLALKAAELNSTGYHRDISDLELLENIENMWVKLGRQPTCNDIKNGYSKYGVKVYFKRFGSRNTALEYFIKYINGEIEFDSKTVNKEVYDSNANEKSLKNSYIHKTKRDINLRLRFLVMKRYCFKCCMCGASPSKDPNVVLHIDHIIPWSKGGETTIDNLQTLCDKYNLGKSDLLDGN